MSTSRAEQHNTVYKQLIMGRSYFMLKKYSLAITAFSEAINLDQNCKMAFNNRAHAYAYIGKHANAVQDYLEAERLGCEIDYNSRSQSYCCLGKHKEAILDAINQNNKDTMRSLYILGLSLPNIQHGELDEIPKETLFNWIKKLEYYSGLDTTIKFLKDCLDGNTPLGDRFWKHEPYSIRAPSLERGTLKDICDYLQSKDPTFVKPISDKPANFFYNRNRSPKVTNPNENSAQTIENLRLVLMEKKQNKEDYSEPQSQLSMYYLLSKEEGGMTYTPHPDCITYYVIDFLYHDIYAAESFVREGLKDILMNKEDPSFRSVDFDPENQALYKRIKYCANSRERVMQASINQTNYQTYMTIWQECNEMRLTVSIKEQQERALHYLGLEEDPERVIYNREQAATYVHDWLAGIAPAEDYVIKVIKEDPSRVIALLEQLDDSKQFDQLLELVLKHQEELKDVQFMVAFKFKKAMRTIHDASERAAILAEAYDLGVLNEVMGAPGSYLYQLILNQPILASINNPDLVVTIALHLGEAHKKEAIGILFHHALTLSAEQLEAGKLGFYLMVFYTLKTHWDQPHIPSTLDQLSIQQDIAIDYSIASLLRNLNDMLDLAWKRNSTLFCELFCRELAELKATSSSEQLIDRQDFYQALMQHPDMLNFPHFGKCRQAVESAYAAHGLNAALVETGPSIAANLGRSLTQFMNRNEQKATANFSSDEEKRPDLFDL